MGFWVHGTSGSTDDTLKLWDLKRTSLEGLSSNACSLYFKGHTNKKIEAIVQDVAALRCISTIDALNIQLENQFLPGSDSHSQGGPTQIPTAFRNFSMSQKDKTLDELVKDHWLSLADGKIGLGVRFEVQLCCRLCIYTHKVSLEVQILIGNKM